MRNACQILVGCLMTAVSPYAAAQQPASASISVSGSVQDKVRAYRATHEKQILGEFASLLSIPNLASDASNIERNAQFIRKMLETRGVAVRFLTIPGAPPVVFGELRSPDAQATIGIYAHYDGQPTDAAQWVTPPFRPSLRNQGGSEIDWRSAENLDPEWRVYSRSSSDDKAPIEGTMAALDALRAAGVNPVVNVKFIFEGEEEAGSTHLAEILRQHPEALDADIWLLCDGPVHQSRRMQVFFGARGATDLEITVYGPVRPLHSGHYGNWAPNPIVLLTHLIDTMRDTDAHILIQGFYDDVRPLSTIEKHALAQTPAADDQLKSELGIRIPEGNGAQLAAQILKPALNLRGIHAGHVGAQAANVISTEAQASIDFRLVPDQTPEKVRAQVEEHISRQGFYIVHDTPDASTRLSHEPVVKLQWGSGYPPYRASIDNATAQAIVRTIEKAVGDRVIQVVSLGGSVPMYLFEGQKHTPVIGVPIANHDNNQHAADENLRLKNLWDAIQMYASIISEFHLDPSVPQGPSHP